MMFASYEVALSVCATLAMDVWEQSLSISPCRVGCNDLHDTRLWLPHSRIEVPPP